MRLFDSHCHLHYEWSPKTVDTVIAEAKAEGVARLVTIATDLPSIAAVAELSARHEGLWHTAGVHPHDSSGLTGVDETTTLNTIRAAFANPKCVAVGEIGLDAHYDHSDMPTQLKWLEAQLELAREVERPIVVHSREAEPALLERLTAHARAWSSSRPIGVIHCFTGTEAFGRACLDLGFYISFSGILTFKNAEPLRACARDFPLERLLIETDSPYLAPIPFRGKRCEPAMVKHTALKLAELRGLPLEELGEVTFQNASTLFELAPVHVGEDRNFANITNA